MTAMSSRGVVEVRRLLKKSPKIVFRMWTNPERMVRWMSPYPGTVACTAEADARVGGNFRLAMGGPDSVCEISGTYVAVDPYERLAFTWKGPTTLDVETLVTVTLKPVGEGTELVLSHERLPQQARQGYSGGWTTMLGHLEESSAD
jgi:uncharacterized protein YndB with AHSA1/START domain